LISSISHYNGLVYKDLPLIDETGIRQNINISISAIMTDLEDVKRALQEYGLNIVQKERECKLNCVRS
jgi:hypothetical protein